MKATEQEYNESEISDFLLTLRSEALVLIIGNRFFRKFGKKERLLRSYHLAGAKLFLSGKLQNEDIDKIESKLSKRSIQSSPF